MTLQRYQRKRRFDSTREPSGADSTVSGNRAIFVVQLHHASHRHYDFRLQMGGVLRSWAVPKGPSLDPAVKRMAIEVEDHPIDYAQFEGDIPKGQYGGGHVAKFDSGVWSTEADAEQQLLKGHLRFELFGRKLKGAWHLVRSKKPARQPQWLLFKEKDAYACALEADDLLGDVSAAPAAGKRPMTAAKKAVRKPARPVPLPRSRKQTWAAKAMKLERAVRQAASPGPFVPELAKLGQTPPEGPKWLHEIKWDGYRLLATVIKGKVRLWSRNAIEWTQRLPEIREAVEALELQAAMLDGELIAGKGSREDFNLLQATLSGERQAKLSYVLFDVLNLEDVDVAQAPLTERKALLQEVLSGREGQLSFSSHVEGEGGQAYRLAEQHGFEGIISKRADRPYQHGRSEDWRKTKLMASDEFAVVGHTSPKGSRTGFGALLLARPDGAHGWIYAGRVGSGFNDALLHRLTSLVGTSGSTSPSVQVPVADSTLRAATWFPPRFVVEVFYRGIGRNGLLRQPSFKALRLDKNVEDLLKDPVRRPEAISGTTRSTREAATMKASSRTGRRTQVDASSLPVLTSPSKLLFPDERISKRQVWDYYLAVADHLLPAIAGRPLSVVRCPSGIADACFFQKHLTAGFERVASVSLEEESGIRADYLVVEDLAGMMELVQFNALEFHPWGAHADTPEKADRVIFDLDPGANVPFSEVKQAARDIRGLLEKLELESFVRLSGGKGIHVVVPLNPGCGWDLTKRFARGFAEALAQSQPHRFLSTASKRLRNRRIFIDYLRNGRGATAVASYSLRARADAPVAMPLAWGALSKVTSAHAFTLKNVPAKLKRRRQDPWEGIDSVRQDLSRWAEE